MAAATTFYWHDYETFGIDPQRDRPSQFAGVRTDADFNIIGEPLVLYCTPADDYLPDPDACLITGITPQKALAEGVCEAEFARRIHAELSVPGTCALGYNSLRFDDEFTRNLLYRNFYDPYAREWRDGNSRWDLLDVVRLARALRPDGIEWPRNDDGTPTNRLELLTQANGLTHEQAHDALSDVYATIAMAKLLREKQPRLFDYAQNHRDKRSAGNLLNLRKREALVHVSGMIPGQYGHTAVVMPLARHPTNNNGVIVFDLREDPTALLELDADGLHRRIFTAATDLPEGVSRIPLKTVHLNKCPILAPTSVLDADAQARLHIDLPLSLIHRERILAASEAELTDKIQQAFGAHELPPISDPDQMIYSGGFFSDDDRERMAAIRAATPEQLADQHWAFDDPRVPEMLFRYRARNFPGSLTADEQAHWDEYRAARLLEGEDGARTLDDVQARLEALADNPQINAALLHSLHEYAEQLADSAFDGH
jgi:exodeoxyribonuclease-1